MIDEHNDRIGTGDRGIDEIAGAPGTSHRCPICFDGTTLLDVVDFNKSCAEARGLFLEMSGRPIYYRRCSRCGFVHAPEIADWPADTFRRLIYNDDYVGINPDYLDARPRANLSFLLRTFNQARGNIRHLDYGGGNGKLSQLLSDSGWDSISHEPFGDPVHSKIPTGKFDLITAFEVFEHHPAPHQLMQQLCDLVSDRFLIVLSTLISDGKVRPNARLNWWYAAPRNGHISLYSGKSLSLLAQKHKLNCGSLSDNLHVFWGATIPEWATSVLAVK